MAAVLSADARLLCQERGLVSLFVCSYAALPGDTTARLEVLINDDRFVVGLLRASVINQLSQPMEGGATQHSFELNWQLLTTWISEAALAVAVNRVDVDLLGLDQDARAIVLEAQRHAFAVKTPAES